MNDYDVIIIGAGLGGLTAGAKLSKEGKRVAIVEQHSIPGGCATTFRRKGFTLEVGLHELDGLHEADTKYRIFHELDIFKNINFLRVPEFYRYKKGSLDLIIPDNIEEAVRMLIEKYPDDEKAINHYFKTIIAIRRELSALPLPTLSALFKVPFIPLLYPHLLKYWNYSIGDYLDKHTDNEELKLILTANLSYYHDDPRTMSFLYFSAGQASYMTGGGHYIQGGSQKLSDLLAERVTEKGGTVYYRSLVTSISSDNGRVTGVVAKDLKKGTEFTLTAPVVIANTAIPNLPAMLPAEAALDIRQQSRRFSVACSILTLYVGFNQPPANFGCKHYSTFVAPESLESLQDVSESQHSPFTKRGFVFVDYSQLDSQLAPEGKAVGALCLIDYIDAWENLNPSEYKDKKETVTKALIARLEEEYPGISASVEYAELGTPKTIKRYTMTPKGTPYGFAQTPDQAIANRIRQKGALKGLYYASVWTIPGGGFTGAIVSGFNCARQILKRERLRYRILESIGSMVKALKKRKKDI